jgi:chromate reductase
MISTNKEPPLGHVRILVFSGSLRQASLNTRLAELAAQAVGDLGAEPDVASMRDFDVPVYDGDLEQRDGLPAGAHSLRDRLIANDGFILAAPEYNASVSGAVKNLIDWTSRFRPQPFREKQALLLSASPSMAGGNRGLWALRVPLEHLGSRVYPDMFSLAKAHQAFDEDGQIADPKLREHFSTTIRAFVDLVEAAKHYPCAKARWIEFPGEHIDPATLRVEE